MEFMLFRTCSGSVPFNTPMLHASRRNSVSLPVHDSAPALFSGEICVPSQRISLHMEMSRRNISRSSSESDIMRSEVRALTKLRSQSFTALPMAEEECDEGVDDLKGYAGDWPASRISWEESEFPGGGMKRNWKSGGGGNGSNADRHKIGTYYQEMLKSDPTNSLLLGNYAKYLHEVEGDAVKAEEYYGRAILASPGDGEVLSLYGKLIWETQRDESRAKSYFSQALHASPHDCTVLGSYAHFMWEAEEEQDGDEDEEVDELERGNIEDVPIAAMVETY